MSKGILQQIGDLPPIHGLIHLGLWHYPPFSWAGYLLRWAFGQHLLHWSQGHLGWLLICSIVRPSLTLELLCWMWSWLRGRQINYDEHKAKFWTTGPRAGKLKAKPINLDRARARRYAWPRVGLPFYLVAIGMYVWFLAWPTGASQLFLAAMWFAFTPVRRVMFIATARKAYRANHPDDSLETTLLQDVYNYFYTGIARPKNKRPDIEPPFESAGWISKIGNGAHALFSRYGLFWRIFRVWNIFRFWGILVQLGISFFWWIAAPIAPFVYMAGVEDYAEWMNPWWRRYRKQHYGGQIIKGEVVKTGTTPAQGNGTR